MGIKGKGGGFQNSMGIKGKGGYQSNFNGKGKGGFQSNVFQGESWKCGEKCTDHLSAPGEPRSRA
eukprot:4824023-Karenia_brevis.AAC.1